MLSAPSVSRVSRPIRRRWKASDWGLGMSVCIASMADHLQAIVIATDQMAAVGDLAADHVMAKVDLLAHPATVTPFWAVLWSGDDITSVSPIITQAQTQLKKGNNPRPPFTADEVAKAMAEAYQREMRVRINADILSPFDIEIASFATHGKDVFKDEFSAVVQRISQYDLGCEFLVCGFHEGRKATIFSVGRRGVVEYHDKFGFWVIGSGSHLALSSFLLRAHNNRERSLAEAIYNVCEAKFWAELSGYVGQTTTLMVLDRQHFLTTVSPETIGLIKAAWQRDGRPPISTDAVNVIHDWIEKRS
jgi:hypothetical protein